MHPALMNLLRMDSAINKLFEAKENISDTQLLLEIKQHYQFTSETLHLIVEAEDDIEFYRKSIEYVYKGFEIKYYAKNGKKNVLTAYEVLDWNLYHKSRILFFVDKDFEDILGRCSKKDSNIFVTKYYSIENYLATDKNFRYVLESIFKIQNPSIVDSLISKFQIAFKEFETHLLFLTAIILIFRRQDNHLTLDKIKMDDFFLIENLELKLLKYRRPEVFKKIKKSNASASEKKILKETKVIDCIIKAEGDPSKVKSLDVLNNIRLLKDITDSKKYIRGKYHLWFFIKSLRCIHSMSSQINIELLKKCSGSTSGQTKKINLTINIDESNIFDLLPMKIDTHNDVNIFLIQNLQKYNA